MVRGLTRSPVLAFVCLATAIGGLSNSMLSIGRGESPTAVLNVVFPAGGQAGTSVEVLLEGSGLNGVDGIRFSDPAIVSRKGEANRLTITLPPGTPPGTYDLRATGTLGLSSPRAFVVGNRAERVETEPNDKLDAAEQVPLDLVINGRIDKPGDLDCFRFAAVAGQRVVLECRAERIDSRLRAVLEVFDGAGRKLAVSRGYRGTDPLVDLRIPASGEYIVKVFDLTYSGSPAHFYRLDIDTGPRVEFAVPCVVQKGRTTRVALFGRNLALDQASIDGNHGHPVQSGRGGRPVPPTPQGTGDRALAAGGLAVPQTQGTPGTPQTPGTQGPVPQPTGDDNSLELDRALELDRVELDVTPPAEPAPTGLRLLPCQMTADAFPCLLPGSDAPVLVCMTDLPVFQDAAANHSAGSAQALAFPCEVSGQLTAGDEHDWYAIQASRGDVLWIEAFGERIGSPVDLDLVLLDASGEKELEHFTDAPENPGGYRFPLSHLDPSGRWVAPADGRYLVLVRNLTGGAQDDPRRVYRLAVRREVPDFHLAVVSPRTDQPAGPNLGPGRRQLLEVIADRSRGCTGPIRVTADQLPPGVQCPDVWLGPGELRAPLVLTCEGDALFTAGPLVLSGHADLNGAAAVRRVMGGTMVWPAQPMPSGRLVDSLLIGSGPAAPLVVTATPAEISADQDSVIEVSVDLVRHAATAAAPIELSGVNLPTGVRQELTVIEPGKTQGVISFFLPESLAPGPYTFALRAAVLPVPKPGAKPSTVPTGVYYSNPMTVQVAPARIVLEIDPRTPRKVARGEITHLTFSAERKQGFIGKIHAELKAPGGVVGLRARGVTFVGQTDSGVLQIIATEDAPLGRQPFLRLEAIGTVEDQPLYRASRFLEIEITE